MKTAVTTEQSVTEPSLPVGQCEALTSRVTPVEIGSHSRLTLAQIVFKLRIYSAVMISLGVLFLFVQGLESWLVISGSTSVLASMCISTGLLPVLYRTKVTVRNALNMIPDLNDPSSVGQICDLISVANLSGRSARQFDPAVKKLVNLLQGMTK